MKRALFSLENPALSLSLGLLFPYFLFFASNVHFFTPHQLGFSVLFLLALAPVLFSIASLFRYFFIKILFKQKSTKIVTAINILYIALCFCILAFLLKMHYPVAIPAKIIFFAIVLFGTFTVVFFRLIKPLNVFLLAMLGFSLIHLGAVAFNGEEVAISDHEDKDFPQTIILKDRPNIYLFILESIQPLPTLQDVYGVKVDDFQQFLDHNNFVSHENGYSNSEYTLMSLCDLFTFNNYSFLIRGNYDIHISGRDIIGGDNHNLVYKILKQNGYYIENIWFFRQSYYLKNQGENLDKTDISRTSLLLDRLEPVLEIEHSLARLAHGLHAWALNRFTVPPATMKHGLERQILQSMAQRPRDQPYCLVVKTGATHTSANYVWTPENDWRDHGFYSHMAQHSLLNLNRILTRIIEEDPDALIILLGDHGPQRFRGLMTWPFPGNEEFDRKCARLRLSREDIAKDMFNVLLSIRMPPGRRDISQGQVLCPRNLFLYIFSELAHDPGLMKWRKPAISQNIHGLIMVEEGKVLPRFSPASGLMQED